MKKILMMAVAMMMTVAVNAQDMKKLSFAAEFGIGTELELGARAQYDFGKYFAWDVLNVRYNYDWDKTKIFGTSYSVNWNEIAITTGVRGFSPEFGPGMKAFANFDLGYGAMFGGDLAGNTSCFAIDFGIGLYVWKGLYAGYTFEALCNNGSHKDHLLRIGYTF